MLPQSLPRTTALAPAERPAAPTTGPLFDLIELLYFAYRDFVGEADAELASLGFGRAHHRVLHFVDRHPGLRVADLLDILKITKQSLARVLRQLVESGCIVQEAGPTDRRERRLHATPKGQALARRLAELQSARIARALAAAGPEARETVRRFLFAMIAPQDRDGVAALVGLEARSLARREP
jgi:DNA-binding MarR family transcriptional regulator